MTQNYYILSTRFGAIPYMLFLSIHLQLHRVLCPKFVPSARILQPPINLPYLHNARPQHPQHPQHFPLPFPHKRQPWHPPINHQRLYPRPWTTKPPPPSLPPIIPLLPSRTVYSSSSLCRRNWSAVRALSAILPLVIFSEKTTLPNISTVCS